MDIPVNSCFLLFLSVTIVMSADKCLKDSDCPDIMAMCFEKICLCRYDGQYLKNGTITSCKKECSGNYDCPDDAVCNSLSECECTYGVRYPSREKIGKLISCKECSEDHECPSNAECSWNNKCKCKYGGRNPLTGQITSCSNECSEDYQCPNNAECSWKKCQCKYGGRYPLTGQITSCSNECSYDFDCVTNAKCRDSICVCNTGESTRFNGKITYCASSSAFDAETTSVNVLGIVLGVSGTVIFITAVLIIILRARRLRMLRTQTTTYVQTPAIAHGVPIAAQSYPATYPTQQYPVTPLMQGHNAGFHPTQPPPYTSEDNK